MKPGWNPVRRSRTIGTERQGRGADNRMVIPESWHAVKPYWESLGSYVKTTRAVGGKPIIFFVEHTQPGWFHPCTLDDICMVLKHIPSADLKTFDLIILRQPKRKQRILCPVWGRAIFYAEVDKVAGPAIILEAQNLAPIKWTCSLTPERVRELDRLRNDGHSVEVTKRSVLIVPTVSSLRNTLLYRTLLHELGHHVDYRSRHERWDELTKLVKEDFAHRYASDKFSSLANAGIIPFEPVFDGDRAVRAGIERHWFLPDAS